MAIYKVYSLPTYPLDHFLALLPSLVDMSSPINCVGTAANFVMHYCLLPVAMECYSDRKEKAHFTNTFLFCTKLEPPSKFQSLFFFVSETQQTEIGRFMPSSMDIVILVLYKYNIMSIILSTGDG